jgi:hypothetical protein
MMKLSQFDDPYNYARDCTKHPGLNTLVIPIQKQNTFRLNIATNMYSLPVIEQHNMCKICYLDYVIEESLKEQW